MTITEIDEKFMREALAEARAAAAVGEVPIGAVVVCAGEIVASSIKTLRRMLSLQPYAPPLRRSGVGAFPTAPSM